MDKIEIQKLTDSVNMWYCIAIQALHELDRPMLLKTEFINEVIDGEWQVLHNITDDGSYLYKAERREEDEICWDSRA